MPSYQYVYVMRGVSKTFPGANKPIFKDITLSFLPNAKIGVLGPNGAGKSTLLKIMAGLDQDIAGEAWAAEGIKVGYLAQEPQLDTSRSVMDNVMDAVSDVRDMVARYNEVSMKFGEVTNDDEMNALTEEMSKLQDQIEAKNGWELERTVQEAMRALNCPAGDADITKLSGGEKRRVALTKLLLEAPDILLLDEPTNHLDAESVQWLQQHLLNYQGMVVMITHDRYFLDNVTGWILEMDRGSGIPYEGNYSTYLEKKAKRLEQESSEAAARQRTLNRELEWIRQGVKARQAKSKARISSYYAMLEESEKETVRKQQIAIPTPPRLGDLVVEATNVQKAYGKKTLMSDLNFRLPPGGIVGVIGPNGAGKTTLFRMITGQEKPDAGTFKIGDTVKLGYVDQSRDSLKDTNNVWAEISGEHEVIKMGKLEVNSRAYVASFNFRGTDQQKKVGQLSGGERNRVHMAKMLQKEANLLLLDEPTNDLDTETLAALEDALENFAGCAVVISHDR
ncbi:MAG TPA: energy-dependent translational throttle protein EttA, partial [Alphaproteobacteria bacterium]